jgi:hypothetical protein
MTIDVRAEMFTSSIPRTTTSTSAPSSRRCSPNPFRRFKPAGPTRSYRAVLMARRTLRVMLRSGVLITVGSPAVWPRQHTDRTDGAADQVLPPGTPPPLIESAARGHNIRGAVTSGGVAPLGPNKPRGYWIRSAEPCLQPATMRTTGTAKEFRTATTQAGVDSRVARDRSQESRIRRRRTGAVLDYFGPAAGPPGQGITASRWATGTPSHSIALLVWTAVQRRRNGSDRT